MAINKNYKAEMIERAMDFLADYENGTADTTSLEIAAEHLLKSAHMANVEWKEAERLIGEYNDNFDTSSLEQAVKMLIGELQAA